MWGPILVGVVAAMSGFLVAWFNARQTATGAAEVRLEDYLLDSLEWFECGTQKRNIGLAVIEANRSRKPLHATWRSLLVSQAAYLVAVSTEDTEHERQNLRRIRELLAFIGIDTFEKEVLRQALMTRATKKEGLWIDPDELEAWDTMSGFKRRIWGDTD